jgi:hypothetical protein
MTSTTIVPPGALFVRLCIAHAIGRGDPLTAKGFAAARGWHREVEALERSVVTPLSEADATAVLRPYAIDLAAALRPLTILGRLSAAVHVPLRTRFIAASGGATGGFVAEGAPVPVSAMTLATAGTIEAAKCVATLVQSAELFEQAADGTQDLLRTDLLAACAQAADAAFIAPDNAGATGRPAAITNAGVQITSSGSTLANVDADLKALIGAHLAAGNTLATAAFIGHPRSLTHIGSLRGSGGDSAFPSVGAKGGSIWGIPVLASAAADTGSSPSETVLALVEANQVLVADGGQIAIESTSHASVQLNDAPSAGAQSLVSLWQNGLIALKLSRWINWRARRPGAASSIVSIGF